MDRDAIENIGAASGPIESLHDRVFIRLDEALPNRMHETGHRIAMSGGEACCPPIMDFTYER